MSYHGRNQYSSDGSRLTMTKKRDNITIVGQNNDKTKKGRLRMSKRTYGYDENCSGGSGFWKALSVLGILAAGIFAFISFCLKKKNDQYRDLLISMSDEIPGDEELEEENERRWHRAHAPANRKTVEERLCDQRVQES